MSPLINLKCRGCNICLNVCARIYSCAFSQPERIGVISYQKSHVSWRMKLFKCFHFFPPTSHFSLSKTALTTVFTAVGLMGGSVRHVLVWAKSTILEPIKCKTNRNIILNLESWQGKKWEQYEGPVLGSSLTSLSSTHDKANCDSDCDRLWTITSDVFMDFQWDPFWNIAAVNTKNVPCRTALPDLDPTYPYGNHSQRSVMEQSQSKFLYRGLTDFY